MTLKLSWPDGEGDLAEVLTRVLPSGRLAVASVEPDFVGEVLVLDTLARPDAEIDSDRWRLWCEVAERCARRHSFSTPVSDSTAFENWVCSKARSNRAMTSVDASTMRICPRSGAFLDALGYAYSSEHDNPAYKSFLS